MQVLERWEERRNSGIWMIVWRLIAVHMIIGDNHNAFCYSECDDLQYEFPWMISYLWYKNPYKGINGIVFRWQIIILNYTLRSHRTLHFMWTRTLTVPCLSKIQMLLMIQDLIIFLLMILLFQCNVGK